MAELDLNYFVEPGHLKFQKRETASSICDSIPAMLTVTMPAVAIHWLQHLQANFLF